MQKVQLRKLYHKCVCRLGNAVYKFLSRAIQLFPIACFFLVIWRTTSSSLCPRDRCNLTFARASCRYTSRNLASTSGFVPTISFYYYSLLLWDNSATYAASNFFRFIMGRVRMHPLMIFVEPSFIQLWHGGEPSWTHLILAFLCNLLAKRVTGISCPMNI